VLRRFLHGRVVERQGPHVDDTQRVRRTIEDRDVRPERLPRGPPAQACGIRIPLMEIERLRLRDGPFAGRDARRPQPLAAERRGLVQVDETCAIVGNQSGASGPSSGAA
jgi:hypothetical protein